MKNSDLRSVAKQFEIFRNSRKNNKFSPYPLSLWEAANKLTHDYPLLQIAKALKFSPSYLRSKLKVDNHFEPVTFIETSLPIGGSQALHSYKGKNASSNPDSLKEVVLEIPTQSDKTAYCRIKLSTEEIVPLLKELM